MRIRANIIKAKGMNRAKALLALFPLTLVELMIAIMMIAHGTHYVGLTTFIFFLWNLGFIIGLTVYTLTHKAEQASGYMEVSNYSNLNKMGRDKL